MTGKSPRFCRGKVRYRDRIGAEFALMRAKSSDLDKRRETRTYECPICKGWHLTSKDNRT